MKRAGVNVHQLVKNVRDGPFVYRIQQAGRQLCFRIKNFLHNKKLFLRMYLYDILHIVGSEAANTLTFLQLGTRLFILSRINKDYNKQAHVNSKLSVIGAIGFWHRRYENEAL